MELLTEKQRETLRNISIFEYSDRENRKGKPLRPGNAEFKMLSSHEIFALICEKIVKNGFSEVKRVSPDEANCIIRVFEKKHMKDTSVSCRNRIYNIYGANCYTTKNSLGWISRKDDFPINYEEDLHRLWFFQDEYIDFKAEFFDVYVKVS